ncbi:hypothetical protein Voja6_00153 [Pseudomonas phage vB_PpuM-Voja-6]
MPRYTPSPRQVSTARNQRLRTPVEQGVAYYEERKRKETDIAIEASGIDAILYPFIRAGRRCTCQSGAPLLDKKGNLSNDQLNNFFNNADELDKEEEELESRAVEPVGRGSANDLKRRKSFRAGDVDFDQTMVVDDPLTDEDETDIDDDDELRFDEEFMGDDFLESGGNTCGVCLSTGYIKGYSIYRGYHLLLTVGDQVGMSDFRVNTIASPYSFALASTDVDGGYVDFNMIVPKGGNLFSYRLMNNTEEIKGFTLATVVTDVTTPVASLADLADGLPHILRVTCDEEFTHFEANFDCQGVRVRIDFPQVDVATFSKSLTGDDSPDIEVSVPSYVSNIGKHSLIRDFKYNRVWYVTSSRPQLNSKGDTVIFIELTARLIQPQEVFNGIL